MSETNNKAVIKKSELVQLQQNGLTRIEIANKYGVPIEEMNKYFRILKITGKAKKKTKYQVEDDTIKSDNLVQETIS